VVWSKNWTTTDRVVLNYHEGSIVSERGRTIDIIEILNSQWHQRAYLILGEFTVISYIKLNGQKGWTEFGPSIPNPFSTLSLPFLSVRPWPSYFSFSPFQPFLFYQFPPLTYVPYLHFQGVCRQSPSGCGSRVIYAGKCFWNTVWDLVY